MGVGKRGEHARGILEGEKNMYKGPVLAHRVRYSGDHWRENLSGRWMLPRSDVGKEAGSPSFIS